MKKSDFEYVLKLLRTYAGWDLTQDKYFIVDRKLYNYICDKGYMSVEDLLEELKVGNKALLWQVIETLTMSETYFYRDVEVFQNFEKLLLPKIREMKRSTKKLRVWSLGCATGQETYSIAMSIKNNLSGVKDWNVHILGSDICSASISKAQKGQYNQFEVQMGLNMKQILQNFYREKEIWTINDDIRSLVEFRRYNLMEEMTYSESYDIIFCRYVMQFFPKEIQLKVLEKIYQHQNPAGFLFIGCNEKIENIEKFYQPVKGFPCLYQAKNNISISEPVRSQSNQSVSVQQKADSDGMPQFVRPQALTYSDAALSETILKTEK